MTALFTIYLIISIVTFFYGMGIAVTWNKEHDNDEKYFAFGTFQFMVISFLPIFNALMLLVLIFKEDEIVTSLNKSYEEQKSGEK